MFWLLPMQLKPSFNEPFLNIRVYNYTLAEFLSFYNSIITKLDIQTMHHSLKYVNTEDIITVYIYLQYLTSYFLLGKIRPLR